MGAIFLGERGSSCCSGPGSQGRAAEKEENRQDAGYIPYSSSVEGERVVAAGGQLKNREVDFS